MNKEKINNKKLAKILFFVLLLLALLVGATYAIYKITLEGQKTHTINTNRITFTYKEPTNELSINTLEGKTDLEGMGQNDYFEFEVKALSSLADNIPYNIYTTVIPTTHDIPSNKVKLSLSLFNSFNEEAVVVEPKLMSEFVKMSDGNSQKIYSKNFIFDGVTIAEQTHKYRLRVWLDESFDFNDLISQEEAANGEQSVVLDQYNYRFKVNITTILDKSGANKPELTTGMIPVYYDETAAVWRKADSNNFDLNNQWYDYDSHMWANAVTVTATSSATTLTLKNNTTVNCAAATCTRSDYVDAADGTVIPITDINTMWVWIPRYKYTVFNYNADGDQYSDPQMINVEFESGKATTGEINCTDNISGTAGTVSEICKVIETDTACTNELCNGKTYTHPAFTFGGEEITGFWVGKFDNNYSSGIRIIPNVATDDSKAVSVLFKQVRSMELADNIYGFDGTATAYVNTGLLTGDTNNIDTHMVKNMEWGAIIYLSDSKYGRYITSSECVSLGCEIWKNPTTKAANSSTGNYSITGCSGAGKVTIEYNKTACTSGYKYNETSNNGNSSSTGNVYGIYDLSGGSRSYAMGVTATTGGAFQVGSAGTFAPDTKYYDLYSYGTAYNGSNGLKKGKLGDCTKEVANISTKTWYYGSITMTYSTAGLWITRGASYANSYGSGGHAFIAANGAVNATTSTTSILVVDND